MHSLKADYQSQFLLSLHLKNIYLLSTNRHLIYVETKNNIFKFLSHKTEQKLLFQ